MNRINRIAEKVVAMRDENTSMQLWLKQQGVDARVKYIWTGSLKGTWRLYNPSVRWTEELANKLNELGFRSHDGRPLDRLDGNGGLFSVFVRGHQDMADQARRTFAKEMVVAGLSPAEVRSLLQRHSISDVLRGLSAGAREMSDSLTGDPSGNSDEAAEKWGDIGGVLKDAAAKIQAVEKGL